MIQQRAVSTFSIVGRDPETGDLGVATASKFLAVGAVVPYAKAEIGAVATQSYANTTFGPRTVSALRGGISLELIHQAFFETDEQHAQRQYGMVDAQGRSFTFTGESCHPWAGGANGENYAAQGNLLAGPQVVEALVSTFLESEAAFPERLMAALTAADAAGGDRRGRQSAALLVVRAEGGYGAFNDRYIDLRIDDHERPVEELARLLRLHRLYFERPSAADILEIDDAITQRLQAALVKSGQLEQASGVWDDASRQALAKLAGVENLEERMTEPGKIDKIVYEYLLEKYA